MVSGTVIQYLLAMANANGVDKASLCKSVGLVEKDISDPDGTFSFGLYSKMLSEGVRLSGNEYFWLMDMNPAQASRNNVIWYYALNAGNFFEGVNRLVRYYALLNGAVSFSHQIGEDGFRVRFEPASADIHFSDYLLDWGFSQHSKGTGFFSSPNIKPIWLETTFSSTERARKYEEYFQLPVKNGQPFNELVYDKKAVSTPNSREPDPNLDLLFSRLLKSHEEIESQPDFEGNLKKVLREKLMDGTPSIASVATFLGLGTRTFQRRMKALGYSYSGFVLKYRISLAVEYLARPEISVTEVAYLVGYSDVAAFSTAFNRIQGCSPSEYRQRLHAR